MKETIIMNAILTGSRAYGTPRPDSDWDVVILADKDMAKQIAFSDGSHMNASGEPNSLSLKFGSLNLIVETDPWKFAIWQKGTAYLKSIAPVSRDTAKAHFQKLEGELKEIRTLQEGEIPCPW